MKLSISAPELKEAVRFALTAINKRHSSPIMTGMLLEAKNGELRAFGADYEAHAAVTVSAEVQAEGRLLVAGHLLAPIVAKMKSNKPVILSVAENSLIVAQGAMLFNLQLMPLEEYPENLDKPLPEIGHINGEDFSRIIHDVGEAASKDYALPELTAVCLTSGGSELRAMTTDRYRLAMSAAAWDPADREERTLLVAADWIMSAAKSVAGGTTLHSDGSRFALTSGTYTTSTQLRSGKYPSVRGMFKNVGPEAYRINRADFATAADAVSVMAEKMMPIKISNSENAVLSLSASGDTGGGVAQVQTDNATPFEIGVNPSFINWAFRTLDAEQVIFTPNGGKPIHITTRDGAAEYLIMPVRLQ